MRAAARPRSPETAPPNPIGFCLAAVGRPNVVIVRVVRPPDNDLRMPREPIAVQALHPARPSRFPSLFSLLSTHSFPKANPRAAFPVWIGSHHSERYLTWIDWVLSACRVDLHSKMEETHAAHHPTPFRDLVRYFHVQTLLGVLRARGRRVAAHPRGPAECPREG